MSDDTPEDLAYLTTDQLMDELESRVDVGLFIGYNFLDQDRISQVARLKGPRIFLIGVAEEVRCKLSMASDIPAHGDGAPGD